LRNTGKFAAILLLLTLVGTPAMACMLPSAALTPAEHECCRRMARQCGSMRMPASHSCCRTEVRPSHAYLKTAAAMVGHDAVAIAPAEIVVPSSSLALQNVAPSFVEHPPPEITLSTIVLKI
jgi:hypothetical protein